MPDGKVTSKMWSSRQVCLYLLLQLHITPLEYQRLYDDQRKNENSEYSKVTSENSLFNRKGAADDPEQESRVRVARNGDNQIDICNSNDSGAPTS